MREMNETEMNEYVHNETAASKELYEAVVAVIKNKNVKINTSIATFLLFIKQGCDQSGLTKYKLIEAIDKLWEADENEK